MTKKYSKAATKKIGKVMHEFKKGKLKSSSGDKVTKRKQAIAIGISEAKEKGLKVPTKKKATARKKAAPVKKAGVKKATSAKKVVAKKSSPLKKSILKKKKASPAAKPAIRATKKITPKKVALKKYIADLPIPVSEEIRDTVDAPVVEQPVNNIPPVEEKRPVIVAENNLAPGMDKKSMMRAAVRNYDNHHLRLSNHAKGGIKPSGKKPLW